MENYYNIMHTSTISRQSNVKTGVGNFFGQTSSILNYKYWQAVFSSLDAVELYKITIQDKEDLQLLNDIFSDVVKRVRLCQAALH